MTKRLEYWWIEYEEYENGPAPAEVLFRGERPVRAWLIADPDFIDANHFVLVERMEVPASTFSQPLSDA